LCYRSVCFLTLTTYLEGFYKYIYIHTVLYIYIYIYIYYMYTRTHTALVKSLETILFLMFLKEMSRTLIKAAFI